MTHASLRYRITGMDCPSCARKLEKALASLPGVEKAQVYFATTSAVLSYSTTPPSTDDVAALGDRLGYGLLADNDETTPGAMESADDAHDDTHDHDHKRGAHTHDHGTGDGPWYASESGRAVLWSGFMLAAAFGLGLAVPAW